MLATCACTRPGSYAMQEARLEIDGPVVLPLAQGSLPVVSVALDEHAACPFLVDSGAYISLIDSVRAQELGFQIRAYSRTDSVTGSGGTSVAIERYVRVDKIVIGKIGIRDVRVTVLDDPVLKEAGVIGILGQDLLARLTWIVDMHRREMHVLPRGGSEAVREYITKAEMGAGAWIQVEADFRPCPFLPLKIAGTEHAFEIEIDTGADSTYLPSAAVALLGVRPTGTRHVKAAGGSFTCDVYPLKNFSLFGLRIDGDIGAVPIEQGLLGMDILGDLVFVLDGPARSIWLHHRN